LARCDTNRAGPGRPSPPSHSVCALAQTAAPASAGTFVWAKGTKEIWAMLDDGSYAAPLTSAAALGMTSVGDPHVAPDGDVVVFDAGTTRFNHYAGSTFHCGFSCEGVYRWQGGQTARLSSEPSNGYGEISTFEHEPEIAGGGRYVYSFYACYGRVGAGFSCEETIATEGLDGNGWRAYGGHCTKGPQEPSANPHRTQDV
jgi:hypothetical protein